jgi:signal transduction histidine kinase
MIRTLGIIIATVITLLARTGHAADARAQVDLRLFPFSNELYEIHDAWDFYPGEFLNPDEVQAKAAPRKLSIIAIVPREQQMGSMRHGTFRLQMHLPESAWHYTVFIPELRSASQIWINGQLVSRSGRPGSSVATEVPALKPLIHNLHGDARTLDIVVHLSAYSNYEFMSSSTPISIGHTTRIFEKQQAAKIRDAFVVGAIFIMAFYHFSLYILRRERLDPLLFGLFCFWIGLRTICRSEGLLIYQFFQEPDFHWQYRFEYWGISLPTATCGYFLYILFHKSISRRLAQGIVVASGLYTLCIGFLPLRMHGVLLVPFEILILIGALYLVKGVLFAKPEQRDGALLIAGGFGVFILTIVNDMLKNHQFLKTITLSHIGLFLFILFQAILISKRFSRAFRRIKDAEVEIRQLNDDLERKVKDRTQTIRIILDNVKAGFLLVGPDLTIKEGFTKSCQEIIGRSIHVGQKLQDLLGFKERERAHFQLAISQVFSGLLPDDVSLSQIHSRIAIDQRVISLQGSIVRDEDAAVHSILFTITDVTGLVKAEKEARINQTLLSILQDKTGFQSFLADSMRELKHAKDACAQGEENRIRMILHTLKGNFATYGLDEVAHGIHTIEDLDVIEDAELEAVAGTIKTFLNTYQDLIGLDRQMDETQGVFVSSAAFDRLRTQLLALHAADEAQRIFEVWVEETRLVPIRSLFGAMLTHTSRLATQLGKDVEIHVSGADVLVNPEHLGPVISNLSHLLRNAVDHGIEHPERRAPKHVRARIDIDIERKDGKLLITVADDGQGLNMERIREVALERGLFTAEDFDRASEQDKARTIFLPGFSTAPSISEISGRGVGMSALLAAVEKLSGQIQVQTQPECGCRFEIHIPEAGHAPLQHKVA